MLAVLNDDGELLALVHHRADIEPALRAVFWQREVQYAEDRERDGTTAEHGYLWSGLDLADRHWTIWSVYDGPSEVSRWNWLQGTVEEAPVWGRAPGGLLQQQQQGAIQIMLTGSGGAPPPDPGIAAYALRRGLEEGYAAGLRRGRHDR